MKKLLAILLFVPGLAVAKSPSSVGPDQKGVYSEFVDVYHDLTFPNIVSGRASSMTITYLNASQVSVSSGISYTNISSTTFTNVGSFIASGVTFDLTNSTITITSGTLPSFMVVGTVTNDNAPAGRFGEYLSSSTADITYPCSTAQGCDLASIFLTNGDWDVYTSVGLERTGTTNLADLIVWSSDESGNNTNDLSVGNNGGRLDNPWGATWAELSTNSTTRWQINASSGTRIYLKSYLSFSSTTPLMTSKIWARRMR